MSVRKPEITQLLINVSLQALGLKKLKEKIFALLKLFSIAYSQIYV